MHGLRRTRLPGIARGWANPLNFLDLQRAILILHVLLIACSAARLSLPSHGLPRFCRLRPGGVAYSLITSLLGG